MNITSKFAAAALAMTVLLGGCNDRLIPTWISSIPDSKILKKEVPKALGDQRTGFYEIGVKTAQGPEVCKASIILPSGMYGSNKIMVSDCKPDAAGESQFIHKLPFPTSLLNAESGHYSVPFKTSKGMENCTVSVDGRRYILGGCTPS